MTDMSSKPSATSCRQQMRSMQTSEAWTNALVSYQRRQRPEHLEVTFVPAAQVDSASLVWMYV